MDPCPYYLWGRYQHSEATYQWKIVFHATWPEGYTWEQDLIPGPFPDVMPSFLGSYRSRTAATEQLVTNSPVERLRVNVTQSGRDRGEVDVGTISAGPEDARPGGSSYREGDPLYPWLTLIVGTCNMWQTTPDIYDYAYVAQQWAHSTFTHFDLPDGDGRVHLSPVGTAYWKEYYGWKILPEVYPEPQTRMMSAGSVDDAATVEAEQAREAGEPLDGSTPMPEPEQPEGEPQP